MKSYYFLFKLLFLLILIVRNTHDVAEFVEWGIRRSRRNNSEYYRDFGNPVPFYYNNQLH